MPKISKTAQEETIDSPISEIIETTIKVNDNGVPIAHCGVNRKINTGNFENIDVYFGVSFQVKERTQEEAESLAKAVSQAAELGFAMVSKETAERYEYIKKVQAGEA